MGNAEIKDFAPVQAHERKELNLSRKVSHKEFIRHLQGKDTDGCLAEFPWAIRDSVSLYEKMDLSFNSLSEIPVELPLRLPHLSAINIGYNDITALPESFALMFHVRVILLNNNKLTSIPNSFVHLVKLEKVDLSGNFLNELPEQMGHMESLKKLNVTNNRLKSLPASLGESKTLRVILAKKNPCENPPKSICDEGSEATLNYLRKQCSPNGVIVPIKPTKNIFPRVRGNQLQHSVPNPQSALVEYMQTQTDTVNTPNRIKTPLIPPIYATAWDVNELKDKIVGLLYGAAIGDALGIATEHMKPDECHFYYDADSLTYDDIIRDAHRTHWKKGDWTTDFDQLCLVLESICHWAGVIDELDFAKRLVTWNNEGFTELGDTEGIVVCNTMTKALSQLKFLDDPHGTAKLLADSAGDDARDMYADNGALSRSLVIGVPHFYKLQEVGSNAGRICKATHYDERCVASSVMVACVVSLLLQGEYKSGGSKGVDQMVSKAREVAELYLSKPEYKEELALIAGVSDYKSANVHEPGKVNYTLKPVACGLAALRSGKDFKTALTDLIMLGADSNANGCITGAFLGCKTGYYELPVEWVEGLRKPQRDWLNVRINLLLDMMGIP